MGRRVFCYPLPPEMEYNLSVFVEKIVLKGKQIGHKIEVALKEKGIERKRPKREKEKERKKER
jgi:hypothetical protein